ncbi:MAG TPA: trypsin-like peptidase domain-containing protein [Actinomycetota bacterium]|nr:trypsin-like peptidase domain-containing protein [Actinomycetota bacterium]
MTQTARIFLGGLGLWAGAVVVTFSTGNANLVPTIILLGSFLVPAAFVTYAFAHADEVVTAQRIFTAFVYGGVLGVLGASVLEAAFLRRPSGPAYVGVGLIEEAVKLAALWLLARRLPRYTMRDGIVLGAAVGFGFAAFESAGYAFNALFTSRGLSLLNLVETEVLRGILAPVGHGLWTAILGGTLFGVAAARGRLRLSRAVLGWYVLVALLHALWDASRPIAVWLTLLLTGTRVQWLLIQLGRAPAVTPAQVHLFAVFSWALLALDGLLGLLVLRRRWRRASRLDRPATPRIPRPALLALVVLALALTGCTASSASTPASSAAPAPAADVKPSAVALQQQFVQVVKQVGPSVVLIQTGQGLGSGIVFDAKGDVVTNNHVVEGGGGFQVTLANGRQYRAQLVGTFAADDLAVLHIDAGGLQAAAFADSSNLEVGDVTLAIGNPLGLQSSVTEGIVSALGRTVNEDNGVALPNVIQTSAAINPGNSGGALVNLQGQVIGIPTLAATDPQLGGSAAPGIGFAIPSNTVRSIASQLIDQGKVTNSHRAWLGVEVAATTSDGLLVSKVQAGSPAAKAGIRAGALITAVNGTATPDPAILADVLAGLNPGQTVNVTVARPGGPERTVRVTLGQFPG